MSRVSTRFGNSLESGPAFIVSAASVFDRTVPLTSMVGWTGCCAIAPPWRSELQEPETRRTNINKPREDEELRVTFIAIPSKFARCQIISGRGPGTEESSPEDPRRGQGTICPMKPKRVVLACWAVVALAVAAVAQKPAENPTVQLNGGLEAQILSLGRSNKGFRISTTSPTQIL